MTGGSEKTKIINEKLAVVARETCLPIASGSLSVAIKNPSLVDSFKIIRKVNPKGLVFANLGAGHNVENAKKQSIYWKLMLYKFIVMWFKK